ncbi:MAG: sigma 54-interacting transcriptional regulator [Negativicutes bacterium]|nr:sigma 54-interacting transcriptional regulator [Negativicutes bacterium]
MTKTLFVLPDEVMVPYAKDILASRHPDIQFVAVAPTEEAVDLVRTRIAQGVEIVAARAGIASRIRQARLNVSLVEIPVTSFDVIRAINEAKYHGKKIAVVALTAMVSGIDYLAEVLGVNIRHYAVKQNQDYDKAVAEAAADGAEVILGGVLAVNAASRRGIPCALIRMGQEGLLQAAREAAQIREALEIEAVKRGFFSTILDYSHDGIITIDRDRSITACNPVAQKLTKVSRTGALGKPVEQLLPQLKFDEIQQAFNRIIDIKGTKVMCDSVPITINRRSFGAVITLQEVSKIQRMEAMIRSEVYARGHVAKFCFADIIGDSQAITGTIAVARDFAATHASVLISGETGTGKEVFAQSIHNASRRAKGPFVAINCAALPAQLLESELFGYVGGAFTGANKEGKPGLFEVAHGGTIFLDELAEMDYINQGRLLRVLQEKTVVRLGSYKVTPVDVRVITATNKDIEGLVEANKFRDDLYYRLNVLRLELPALRERASDIRLFAEAFLQQFAAESGRDLRLTPDALQRLKDYPWPGNIRECRNLMERIAAAAKTDVITSDLLEGMLRHRPQKAPTRSPKEERLAREITAALTQAGGNATDAAEILGINRTTLWRRMQKYHIEY